MRVFVTGAAGFIGSHLLGRLLRAGFEIKGCDNFTSYYSPDLKRTRLDHFSISKFVENVDVSSSDFFEVISDFKPELVVHLAAQPGVRFSRIDPMSYISSNIVAFENLINALRQTRVSRLIYASSSSVYGFGDRAKFVEADRGDPVLNLYALSKRFNEDRIHIERDWLQSTGLRFFSVYGPLGRPDMAYFRLAAAAMGVSEFQKIGQGNQMRDFTYIDDVVESIVYLIKEELHPKVLNIGGGMPVSLNQLIEEVSNAFEVSDLPMRILDSDLTESIYTDADMGLASKLGLPLPQTSVKTGIQEFVKWLVTVDKHQVEAWIRSSK